MLGCIVAAQCIACVASTYIHVVPVQGMDAVTRQTGQHIEFEPEWEGAFNLQLKLEDIIAIMLDWCAGDVS